MTTPTKIPPAVGTVASFVQEGKGPYAFSHKYTGEVLGVCEMADAEPMVIIRALKLYVWHPKHPEEGREVPYRSRDVAFTLSELEA
jgi:hypothetical protein